MNIRGILSAIILFIFLFSNFCAIGDATSHESLTIPFEGMIIKYEMTVTYKGFPLYPLAKFWVIYQTINDSLIQSRLNVVPDLPIGTVEKGIVMENITSRLITPNVSESLFLNALYTDFFSPQMPNYTPFWIFPSDAAIGNTIPIWNYTFSISDADSLELPEIGNFDIWKLIHIQQNSSSVDHEITLLYEQQTGVLVSAHLWIEDIKSQDVYDAKLYLVETNVNFPAKPSEGFNLLYLPLIGLFVSTGFFIAFKLLRTQKMEGGI